MLFFEIGGLEERGPTVLLYGGLLLHGLALLNDVWSQRPFSILLELVVGDHHQPGPEQPAVVLVYLLLVNDMLVVILTV